MISRARPSDEIGQAAGKQRSGGAAQQHRGDIEAGADAIGLESAPQAVHRAVDDPAIEAEQEGRRWSRWR